MLNFSRAKAVDFLPDDDARAWVADGLFDHAARLADSVEHSRLITEADRPTNLDDLFEMVCGLQSQVGQRDVEFTMLELEPDQPELPKSYVPLGNPVGQMMHTFVHGSEFLTVVMPAVFRVPELLFASVARELGRIAVHRSGGHRVKPPEFEADAELAAIVMGMGVWVANGSYIFENGCCGGGCGVDLRSIRAGLSMPEACFATALDGHRRGVSRRALAKHLESTQKAAFKQSWGFVGKQASPRALTSGNAGSLAAAET